MAQRIKQFRIRTVLAIFLFGLVWAFSDGFVGNLASDPRTVESKQTPKVKGEKHSRPENVRRPDSSSSKRKNLFEQGESGEQSLDPKEAQTATLNFVYLLSAYNGKDKRDLIDSAEAMLKLAGEKAVPVLKELYNESLPSNFMIRSSVIFGLEIVANELKSKPQENQAVLNSIFNIFEDELRLDDRIAVTEVDGTSVGGMEHEEKDQILHKGNYVEEQGQLYYLTDANKAVVRESLRLIDTDEARDLLSRYE